MFLQKQNHLLFLNNPSLLEKLRIFFGKLYSVKTLLNNPNSMLLRYGSWFSELCDRMTRGRNEDYQTLLLAWHSLELLGEIFKFGELVTTDACTQGILLRLNELKKMHPCH